MVSRCCSEQAGWEYLVWFCRIWGMSTAIAWWGLGIEMAFSKDLIGYYFVAGAPVLTLLETSFLIDAVFRDDDQTEEEREKRGCCRKLWKVVLWVDDWRKTFLYSLLSVLTFIRQFVMEGDAWLSLIGGTMILFSALLYLIKTRSNTKLKELEPNAYRSIENPQGGGSAFGSLDNDPGENGSIQSGSGLLSQRGIADQEEIMQA